MRCKIRFDSWHGDHVRFSVFMNGALCGQLCMLVGEYQAFVASVLLGAEVIETFSVKSDDAEFSRQAAEQPADGLKDYKLANTPTGFAEGELEMLGNKLLRPGVSL